MYHFGWYPLRIYILVLGYCQHTLMSWSKKLSPPFLSTSLLWGFHTTWYNYFNKMKIPTPFTFGFRKTLGWEHEWTPWKSVCDSVNMISWCYLLVSTPFSVNYFVLREWYFIDLWSYLCYASHLLSFLICRGVFMCLLVLWFIGENHSNGI